MAGRRARGARQDPRGVRRACCCRRGRASRSSGAGRTVTVTPKPATAAAPDGARRWGSARRGAARGRVLAAADAADEHRPGRARRVRRGRQARRLQGARRRDDRARRSCTSPTIPSGRGPRSGRTCCTRRRRTRRTRRPGQHSTPGVKAESVDDLQASPQFVVGTPEQVRARLEQVPPDGSVTFSPLAGGLPPDLAWASLELFAAQVLPHLRSPATGSGLRPERLTRPVSSAASGGTVDSVPPEEVGNGPVPPFRHHPRRRRVDADRARSDRGCALATGRIAQRR